MLLVLVLEIPGAHSLNPADQRWRQWQTVWLSSTGKTGSWFACFGFLLWEVNYIDS